MDKIKLGILGVGSIELVDGSGGSLAVGSEAVGGLEGDQRSLGLGAERSIGGEGDVAQLTQTLAQLDAVHVRHDDVQ